MPIVMESQSHTQQDSAQTTISIALPSGVVADDVMVATLSSNGASGCTPPAGWTEIVSLTGNSSNPRQYAYYKKHTGSEPDPAVFTLDTSTTSTGGINRFSGVDTTTALDCAATSIEQEVSTDGDVVVPAVTTVTADAVLISGTAFNSSSKIIDAVPSGFTQHWERSDDLHGTGSTPGRGNTFGTKPQPSTGSSGTATWSWTRTYGAVGWMCALRPAAAGPAPGVTSQLAVRGSGQ